MRRTAPRQINLALAALTAKIAPETALAEVQAVWKSAVGEQIAAVAQPAQERDGVLTVVCDAAVWAAELNLLSGEIIGKLNRQIHSTQLKKLRCRTGKKP